MPCWGVSDSPRRRASLWPGACAKEDVLPGYAPVAKPLYFVMREHLRDSPNVRAFRQVLVEHLSRIEGFSVSPDL